MQCTFLLWTHANPLDVRRCAGGSSSGSAAAVASGMSAVAMVPTQVAQYDFLRYCGIIGIKPAYGHVSRHGLIPNMQIVWILRVFYAIISRMVWKF